MTHGQPTSEEKKVEERKPGRRKWIWISIVALPILYFLLAGPAWYLAAKFPSTGNFFDFVYYPIGVIYENKILEHGGWYENYRMWWGKLALKPLYIPNVTLLVTQYTNPQHYTTLGIV